MKRILIVEDDPRVATALAARLRASGYEVAAAPDPAFAILLASTQEPDLIIADIFMPVMQGLGFARRLSSLGLRRVPVIFITASQQRGLCEAARELGAAAFFQKPYDPKQLLAAIASTLETSPGQQAPSSLDSVRG